jgi:Zn finger protein HypA/HybF involved in hydrogenase expression
MRKVVKVGVIALLLLGFVSLSNVEAQEIQQKDMEKYWSERWESPLPKEKVTYPLSFAFETYQESVHGKARALGVERAPTCEDCHEVAEWSKILPITDPNSPVHEKNQGKTCAKCHGERMLTAKVTEGSMHAKISYRRIIGEPYTPRVAFPAGVTYRENFYYIGPVDLASLTNWFFSLLTLSVMTVFITIVFFSTFRMIRERKRGGKGGKD